MGKSGRKRILLVFPRRAGDVVANDAVFPFPLLGLTQIAAVLERRYEVRIVDESASRLRGDEAADLVMLSLLTPTASRGYQLADAFRARGVPVVLGGVHVTVRPQEAAAHATSLVIGEAEDVLGQLMDDFDRETLAPVYTACGLPALDDLPPPAVHLLGWRHRFFLSSLQTSRGCPNSCGFCSVPAIFGRRLRHKSLATIDAELAAIRRYGSRQVFVVDDNFTIDRQRAREIMALFQRYKVRWMGFSTLSVAEDEAFLADLERSGCISLFIGFESLNKSQLFHKNNRYQDRAAISRAVARIHGHGMGIQGSFIFGFDEDGPEVFAGVAEFIQEQRIELPMINILTPFPGTRLYDDMAAAGRLLHTHWDAYDMSHAVIQPARMSPEELQQGYAWALKYLASPTTILRRLRPGSRHYFYFLMANFSLQRSQTRLARSLWRDDVQRRLEAQGALAC